MDGVGCSCCGRAGGDSCDLLMGERGREERRREERIEEEEEEDMGGFYDDNKSTNQLTKTILASGTAALLDFRGVHR